MKILIAIPILLITVLLVSCGPEDTQNQNSESVNASQTAEEHGDNDEEISASNQKEDQSDAISASAENHDTDEASSEETGDDDANDRANKESLLSKYPADKIEYARVWLQVVGNTEVEELTVRHLSAGELVNPYSEDSATFSEEVIQLGGKRMADGIVTYSGNGDGTINLYNLPSHWPSPKQIDQSMEEYTEDMVTNTKQIYIEPVDNKTLISLIHKLTVQE